MELTSPGFGGGHRCLHVSGTGERHRLWMHGLIFSVWARSSTRWRRARRRLLANRRRKSLPRLLKENPPPVSTLNPAMPKKLDAIVEKLLRKDPAQRYSTAEQLREDLENLDASGTRPAEKAIGIEVAVGCGCSLAVADWGRAGVVEIKAGRHDRHRLGAVHGGRGRKTRRRSSRIRLSWRTL